MSESGFSKLRNLVESALARPAGERDAFLEESCGADADLLREARELCAASERDDSFLETPAVVAPTDRQEPTSIEQSAAWIRPGLRIGSFRLIRSLASGGMGVVYEAEQDSPRRRVALKLMRGDLGRTDSVRRFRYESQLLARLRHPSIAEVYEAGVHTLGEGASAREVPWFALEYVEEARAITSFAREKRLSTDERLNLFERVCEGVHHGHQKGVIHRDLKPDNLLVDANEQVKIIDFGIARLTDETSSEVDLTTMQTHAGTMLGTLPYMSPEQVSGERDAIDLRSDIYSLGVLLFELLTERLPYALEGKSILQTAEIIRNATPERASGLPDDLNTILGKALEKDPARRYGSVQALADDLRRFRNHEPVEARPASRSHQLRLFARRHRALVSAALVVLLTSLLATAISAWFGVEARASERRSDARFEQVRGLANTLMLDIYDAVKNLEGATRAREEIVSTALTYLDELGEEVEGRDDLQLERAVGYTRLGEILGAANFSNLGRPDEALGALGKARAILEGLVENNPADLEAKKEHLRVLQKIQPILMAQGKGDESLALVQEAEGLARDYFETDAPVADRLFHLAAVLTLVANTARRAGNFDRALETYQEALDHMRQRAELAGPDKANDYRSMSVALVEVASLKSDLEDWEGASASYEQAIAMVDKALALEPTNDTFLRSRLIALSRQGWMHLWRDEFDDARTMLSDALALCVQRHARDPNNHLAAYDAVSAYSNLAHALTVMEDWEGASTTLEKQAGLLESMLNEDPDNRRLKKIRAHALTSSARVSFRLEGKQAGIAAFEQVFALHRALIDEGSQDFEIVDGMLDSHENLGYLLLDDGDYAAAEEVYTNMLAEALEHAELSDPRVLIQKMIAEVRLGYVHQGYGDDEERSDAERADAHEAAVHWFEAGRVTAQEIEARGATPPAELIDELPTSLAASRAAAARLRDAP